MAQNQNFVEIPAAQVTDASTHVEETSLQMEELESRIAPNAVWGD